MVTQQRSTVRFAQLLALALACSSIVGRADDTPNLLDRLHATDVASALDFAGMRPWHLKMSVQLFDSYGKQTDQGTIEEWWNSPDQDRREYKTNGYAATEIRSNGKVYRTRDKDIPPYYLGVLRGQVVHPMPISKDTAAPPRPELRKTNAGKVPLECVGLVPASAHAGVMHGPVPTYCLEAGKNSLRITTMFGSEVITRNSVARFVGQEVAVDIVVSANNVKAASAHIDVLSTEEIPPGTFEPSADTPEVVPPMVDSEGLSLKSLSQPEPLFPPLAKEKHISGIVVVRAIVGTDGAIRHLELISSPSPILVLAAMTAVRQWKYAPYVPNGVPTEFETTIAVNFSFGQ
jgi:TonB family protein